MEKSIKKQIIEELENNGDLYFNEIEKIFKRNNFNYEGDNWIYYPNNETVAIWFNWNSEAIAIVREILEEKIGGLKPMMQIEMLMMGKFFKFELAKDPTRVYKNVRWFPMKLAYNR